MPNKNAIIYILLLAIIAYLIGERFIDATAPIPSYATAPTASINNSAVVPATPSAGQPVIASQQPLEFIAAPGSLSQLVLPKETEIHVLKLAKGGPAVVEVNRPGKNVALILISDDNSQVWDIKTANNTQVSHIFTSSGTRNYMRPVITLNGADYPSAIQFDGNERTEENNLQSFLRSVEKITGHDKIESFASSIGPPIGGFRVNEIISDSKLQKVRLAVTPADQLPSITFKTILNGVAGTYSLSGQLIKPMTQNLLNTAYVPDTNEYYMIKRSIPPRMQQVPVMPQPGQAPSAQWAEQRMRMQQLQAEQMNKYELQKLNENGQVIQTIPLGANIPPMEHPTGITYNSRSKRLMISTLGGEGFMYTYDINKKTWTAASLQQVDLGGLNYDEFTDSVIALRYPYAEEMYYINNDGMIVRRDRLNLSSFPGIDDVYAKGSSSKGITIIPVKEYLVIIAGEASSMMRFMGMSPDRIADGNVRIYLFNRKTGQVQLTYAN
ncbi:hypothetical protein GC177_09275 [bacterium]|nr:hypothetical protein [bacterium]